MIFNKITKKQIFVCLFLYASIISSCGNKVTLNPREQPKSIAKNKFLIYKSFYRDNLLVLQAKIIDDTSESFSFENLTIRYIHNNVTRKYEKEVIEKKKIGSEIEIILFPFYGQRFFQLAYSYQNGIETTTTWKKPIAPNFIPTPKINFVNVDYSSHKIPFPYLTIYFENLNNYSVLFYEKGRIFPLLVFKENLKKKKLNLNVRGGLIRYADSYGNESIAVDITNWF